MRSGSGIVRSEVECQQKTHERPHGVAVEVEERDCVNGMDGTPGYARCEGVKNWGDGRQDKMEERGAGDFIEVLWAREYLTSNLHTKSTRRHETKCCQPPRVSIWGMVTLGINFSENQENMCVSEPKYYLDILFGKIHSIYEH